MSLQKMQNVKLLFEIRFVLRLQNFFRRGAGRRGMVFIAGGASSSRRGSTRYANIGTQVLRLEKVKSVGIRHGEGQKGERKWIVKKVQRNGNQQGLQTRALLVR